MTVAETDAVGRDRNSLRRGVIRLCRCGIYEEEYAFHSSHGRCNQKQRYLCNVDCRALDNVYSGSTCTHSQFDCNLSSKICQVQHGDNVRLIIMGYCSLNHTILLHHHLLKYHPCPFIYKYGCYMIRCMRNYSIIYVY